MEKLVAFLVTIMAFRVLPGQINRCFQVANFYYIFRRALFSCGLMTSSRDYEFQDFARPGLGRVSKLKTLILLAVLETRRSVKSVII